VSSSDNRDDKSVEQKVAFVGAKYSADTVMNDVYDKDNTTTSVHSLDAMLIKLAEDAAVSALLSLSEGGQNCEEFSDTTYVDEDVGIRIFDELAAEAFAGPSTPISLSSEDVAAAAAEAVSVLSSLQVESIDADINLDMIFDYEFDKLIDGLISFLSNDE
jgi:hypothetical protein